MRDRRSRMARVVLLLALLATAAARAGGRAGGRALASSLRRQLMLNNYDYLESSDSAQLTRAPPAQPARRLHSGEVSAAAVRARDQWRAHAQTVLRAPAAARRRGDIDAPDHYDTLLQDDLDVNRRDVTRPDLPPAAHVPREGTENNTLPKYKFLKVGGVSGRRSGGDTRRFLQEERPDGVAILSLGGAPFPEFRLPGDRRQYMGEYLAEEIDVEDQGSDGGLTRRHRAPIPALPQDDPNTSDHLMPNTLEEDMLHFGHSN